MKLMEHNPSVELKDNQGRYISYTCTSVYILHDSKTSLIYQIKSSTAVQFILHKTHFVCNTPFNYNVLINPYIKNHFKYINIVCRLISEKCIN